MTQIFQREITNTNSNRYLMTSYCYQYVAGLDVSNVTSLPVADFFKNETAKLPILKRKSEEERIAITSIPTAPPEGVFAAAPSIIYDSFTPSSDEINIFGNEEATLPELLDMEIRWNQFFSHFGI